MEGPAKSGLLKRSFESFVGGKDHGAVYEDVPPTRADLFNGYSFHSSSLRLVVLVQKFSELVEQILLVQKVQK